VSGFVIREATAADAPGIRRLFARVFGKEMSDEEWRWKFEQNPDGWFGVVAEARGEIVGNYAGWGMRFLLDGAERLVYAVGDVATDPSVRVLAKRSVFRAMTDAFYEEVENRRHVPFCFGFPGGRHVRISQHVVGTRTIFPIVEKRVPREALPPPPSDAASGDFVDERFDSLWQDVSARSAGALAVRDRARVNWRFHARPDRYYRMVWREGRGGLLGWAALSVMGENALVADYLGRGSEGRDLLALFAAAAAEAERLGARRIVFWETPGPAGEIIASLPGESAAAGFALDARIADGRAGELFAEGGHLVPSLYDVV
jgi:hypothetical protein